MYREILVPLDGSVLAEGALPHAREMAKAFGARVTLFSVVEPVSVYPQTGIAGPVLSISMNVEEEMEKARQYLEKVADDLRTEGVEVREIQVRGVVREGDAASEICDYAQESHADIIVMSTHGRSGIQRWVYGSVADRVLRAAKVPVLLIRAQSRE